MGRRLDERRQKDTPLAGIRHGRRPHNAGARLAQPGGTGAPTPRRRPRHGRRRRRAASRHDHPPPRRPGHVSGQLPPGARPPRRKRHHGGSCSWSTSSRHGDGRDAEASRRPVELRAVDAPVELHYAPHVYRARRHDGRPPSRDHRRARQTSKDRRAADPDRLNALAPYGFCACPRPCRSESDEPPQFRWLCPHRLNGSGTSAQGRLRRESNRLTLPRAWHGASVADTI
jgi:hypothetical protein